MSNESIEIRKKISDHLALRNNAASFFETLDKLSVENIIIDFSGVRSISRSFAQEYVDRKKNTRKSIREINTPENIEKMFMIVSRIPEMPESQHIDSEETIA